MELPDLGIVVELPRLRIVVELPTLGIVVELSGLGIVVELPGLGTAAKFKGNSVATEIPQFVVVIAITSVRGSAQFPSVRATIPRREYAPRHLERNAPARGAPGTSAGINSLKPQVHRN